MTLSTLRTMVTNFTTDFQFENFVAASPTAAQLTDQVNRAVRTFSRRTWCNVNPKITLTLTAGTANYDARDVTSPVVARKILHPLFVTINKNPLRGPDGATPGIWGYGTLTDFRWRHQTEDNGIPFRAAWLPGNRLYLSPPPNATVVTDGDNYVSGVYMAANLVNSTDDAVAPDVPEEFHEIIAYLATYQIAHPRAAEETVWQSLAVFDKEAWGHINEMAEDNHNRLLGSSANRGYANQWLQELIY